MSLELSPYQLELNCRRIDAYGMHNLQVDEHGTLHKKPGWFDYFFRDTTARGVIRHIPESHRLSNDLEAAIIATCQAISTLIQEKPPIIFFIQPDSDKKLISYRRIADIIKTETATSHGLFSLNEEVQKAVEPIFKQLEELTLTVSDETIPSDFLETSILIACRSKKCTVLEEKKRLTDNHLCKIQRDITSGRVWNVWKAQFENISWITGGDWKIDREAFLFRNYENAALRSQQTP